MGCTLTRDEFIGGGNQVLEAFGFDESLLDTFVGLGFALLDHAEKLVVSAHGLLDDAHDLVWDCCGEQEGLSRPLCCLIDPIPGR